MQEKVLNAKKNGLAMLFLLLLLYAAGIAVFVICGKRKKETSVPKEDNDTLRSAELLLAQVGALRLAEEKAKRSFRSRTADDFEPISLLRPQEPDLSRVLAFLLNPRETHGQGTLFLSAFCPISLY